jgi:ParB family chromosome partitioning protein
MDLQDIPTKEIYTDDFFNSRGHITPITVIDLANDIAKNGLESPITVQPYYKSPGHKYRCLAGHRRLMAFRVNKTEKIPAFIRTGLNELQARSINLRENLLRQDLNPVQEAYALEAYFQAGWLEEDVAKEFGRSRGWVQVRKMIMSFPTDIQDVIAAGLLSQQQIRDIHEAPRDKQYELIRAIKDAKLRGEKVELKEKKPVPVTEKKTRNANQIFEMILEIAKKTGYGLHTRCMAWCAGEVSTVELYYDIEKYCKDNDLEFEMPAHILQELSGVSS